MSIEAKIAAAVFVGSFVFTACNELPPWLSKSSNGRGVKTECMGDNVTLGEIRDALEGTSGYRYKRALTVDEEIASYDDATCGMSGLPIYTPELRHNRLVLCGIPLTVGELDDRLVAARFDGPWESRKAIKKFKETAKECKFTPTPEAG